MHPDVSTTKPADHSPSQAYKAPKKGARVAVTFTQPGPSLVTCDGTVTAVYPPRPRRTLQVKTLKAMSPAERARSTSGVSTMVPVVQVEEPFQVFRDVNEVPESERAKLLALHDDETGLLETFDLPGRRAWFEANRIETERVDVEIERDPMVQGSVDVHLSRVPYGGRPAAHGPFWSWDGPHGPVKQKPSTKAG